MITLLTLIILTFLIFFIQRKIWKMEKNIVFPIFTGILYYWSLAGSWLFSFDRLTGFGEELGLKYYYLLEKMFYVKFDSVYLQTILMYGAFIIFFQLFIWFGLKRMKNKTVETTAFKQIELNSNTFILIALVTLFVSVWIVKDVIVYSFVLDESVYINIRSTAIRNYTLHQYACWIMIVSLFLYVGLYLREKQVAITVKKPSWVFWSVFIICNLYLVMIGSRHETFFAGIVTILLMSYPYRSIRRSWKLLTVVVGCLLFILVLNDPIRSLMPVIAKKTGMTSMLSSSKNKEEANLFMNDRSFIYHKSPAKSKEIIRLNELKDTTIVLPGGTIVINKNELTKQLGEHGEYVTVGQQDIKVPNPHISLAYHKESVLKKITLSVASIVFSNELFAGHFSMYGVIAHDVKPKIGLSFKPLLYSFIPSTIIKERPQDSYGYYAECMKFGTDQGFTINHITAWYLNLSYAGLIIGPFILSLILLLPFNFLKKSTNPKNYIFALVAICGTTAFGAILVRSGPEVFKALLYESVLIPIFIVFSALVMHKITARYKAKDGE